MTTPPRSDAQPAREMSLNRADADAEALGGSRAIPALEIECRLDHSLDDAVERLVQLD